MAQPTLGTNTKVGINGDSVLSFSHTVAADTDRVLYVIVMIWTDGSGPAGGVTFNGVPLVTVVDSGAVMPSDRVVIFRLLNPPVGTFTVAVTWNNADANGLGFGRAIAYNLSGVDNTGSERGTVSDRQTGTAVSIVVDSDPLDIVIDAVATDGATASTFTMTADTGRTQVDNAILNGELVFSSTETSPAASETMDGTISASQAWAAAAVSVCGPRPVVVPEQHVRTRKVPKVILREKKDTGEEAEEEVGIL